MNSDNTSNLNYNKYRIKRLYSDLNYKQEIPNEKRFKYNNECDNLINNFYKNINSSSVFNLENVEMTMPSDNTSKVKENNFNVRYFKI